MDEGCMCHCSALTFTLPGPFLKIHFALALIMSYWCRHVWIDVQKSLESFIPTLKATRMCQTVFDALGMKLGFLLLRNDNLVLMIQRCSHLCWLGETYVNHLWSVPLTDMRKIPRHTVLLEPLQTFLSGCPNSVAGLRLNADWVSFSLSKKVSVGTCCTPELLKEGAWRYDHGTACLFTL